MAAIAARTIFTQVPVILAVTAAAQRRGLHRARRLVMAIGALQLGVGADQRKVIRSLLRMIERPQGPAVRRMAALAFLAEAALVHVIVRVAVDAGQGRIIEGQRRMALCAAHHPMQPEQREIGQVVVEHDVGAPGLLAVAGFASALELAAVRILAAMAARTVLGELLARYGGRVTGVAIDLGVRAHQRKFVLPGMVVVLDLPALVVVTVLAFLAEARRVRIVGLMAAVAVLRDLVLVVAAAVAGDAVDLIVHAEQFEFRFLEMVELRRLPFLGHVALAAVIAARSTMFIVGLMAAHAGLGRLLVPPSDVACIAGHGHVRARQFEVRLVMIELAAGPAQGTVAFAARLRELFVVDVVFLVAADAGRGSFAPSLAFLVAAFAVERSMRSLEREVGEVMIELRAAELHDVGVAASVLRMAGAAFADAGVGHAAVIALMLPHVLGDILVTIEAQRALRAHVRAVVAVGAGLFLLYMRLRHLAGHEERFHIGGPNRPRCCSDNCCYERHGQ